MTSTIKLYCLNIKEEKNFVIDSIADYLSTLESTALELKDFQYQRLELYKTIKVNLDQKYQGKWNDKWDYLSIKNEDDASYYYYFIKSYKQVSQSTIELSLKMDVINTYSVSASASASTYTLSPKTLVNREHKDRMYKKTLTIAASFTGISYNQYYDSLLDVTFWQLKSTPQSELVGATLVDYIITYYPESGSHTFNTIDVSLQTDGTLEVECSEPGNFALLTVRMEILINYSKIITLRKIDRFQEGFESYLFKTFQEDLLDVDKYRTYYVIYSSLNSVVSTSGDTEAIYVNPVKVNLICDDALTLHSSAAVEVLVTAQDPRIPKVNNEQEAIVFPKSLLTGGAYIKVNGRTYTSTDFTYDYVLIRRKGNNDNLFWRMGEGVSPSSWMQELERDFDGVTFYGVNMVSIYTGWDVSVYKYYGKMFIGSASSGISGTTATWENVDTSNPKLIKAFNFPYCPNEWLPGKTDVYYVSDLYLFNSSENFLQLKNGQVNDFDRQINFGNHNPIKVLQVTQSYTTGQNRDDYFESKIYHSDFYRPKFVYDSFGFNYMLENVDVESYAENFRFDELLIRYVVSGNCLSKFLFQFVQYVCDVSTQDYEDVLIVDRNNEKAIFNNAYINYIKTGGYAYDTKRANMQNIVNAISGGISAFGSGISLAMSEQGGFGSGMLLGVSTVNKLVDGVNFALAQDNAIAQKTTQLSYQSTQVQGNDDMDILKAFSYNKAKMCYYEPSAIMKKAILDLFYYCGYATHEQKIPSRSSRRYFNFIQADIVFDKFTFNNDVATEIQKKWSEGITFIHKVNNAWDLNQEKENIEISML